MHLQANRSPGKPYVNLRQLSQSLARTQNKKTRTKLDSHQQLKASVLEVQGYSSYRISKAGLEIARLCSHIADDVIGYDSDSGNSIEEIAMVC